MKKIDFDAMLARVDQEPREWMCPEHEVEYGEGRPDPTRMTWECPKCARRLDAHTRELAAAWSRYRWWRVESGVPGRYRNVLPEHLKPLNKSSQALSRAVAGYAKNLSAKQEAGQGMLLLGPPGLGKTLALTGLVNFACNAQMGPIYAVWPDVLADMKAGFSGPRDDPRRQSVDRLRNAPLLALDELGVKGQSDFDHSELFSLIDYRYREGLPTLVAANCTPENFPSFVGERVADRLAETGPQIVLTGDSQRGKTAVTGPAAIPEPDESIEVMVHGQGEWRTRKIRRPEARR